MPLLIGTSGWQYRDWRGAFYPTDIKQGQWLEYYAERFDTVEVNNAFYRLPERSVFEAWRARTPEHFVVGVKMSRYLSHIKRLREPQEPVARFLERAAGLGPKLGPVLLQLPPNLQADQARLADTLALFPPDVRVAVEFRHPSWYVDPIAALLQEHRAALVWADRLSRRRTPLWRTADWGYLRFHEGRGARWPSYGDRALRSWAERILEVYGAGPDVYAFFNNDPTAAAPRDAVRFAEISRAAGLLPTRVPSRAELGLPRSNRMAQKD